MVATTVFKYMHVWLCVCEYICLHLYVFYMYVQLFVGVINWTWQMLLAIVAGRTTGDAIARWFLWFPMPFDSCTYLVLAKT